MYVNLSYDLIQVEIHYLLRFYNYCSSQSFFLSENSLGTPFHLTSPPKTDLEALPDPNLAS